MIIVSSCLAGLPTSHDGRDRLDPRIKQWVDAGRAIPVCPEQLGGRPTPREKAELTGGGGQDVLDGEARVISELGTDLSEDFIRGARRVMQIAMDRRCELAVLKARSPSCGKGRIYDGTFQGRLVEGDGVTTAVLEAAGLRVITDEEIDESEIPAE